MRAAGVAGLSAVLALTGHLVGGGSLPTSCRVVLVVLGLTLVATAVACYVARRRRGLWPTLTSLAGGQIGVEALLSAPVDGSLVSPWAAGAVHAAGVLGLAVALMGIERSLGRLHELLDRVLPRWWRATTGASSPRARWPHPGSCDRRSAVADVDPGAPRGPPLRLIASSSIA